MSATAPRWVLAPRLAVFVALVGFAGAHWLSLLTDPPAARAALAFAAIAAGACLLALIDAAGIGRWRGRALALAALLAASAAALVAMGLPASMLVPGGWDELGAGIDRGLGGLGGRVEFPYTGDEQWSRLVILLGLVCLLALGAALAFWPRRPAGSGARIAGLVILVGIFAASAAIRSGAESLLTGLGLLLLVAAWLWLPGLGRRAALVAGAAIAVLGVLALPFAATLDGRPWIDYRSWRWAPPPDPKNFQWNHSYGSLEPRDGTRLLDVESDAPRYLRAAVLDDFDGYRWERSVGLSLFSQKPLELPTSVDRGSPAGAPPRLNPEWVVRTEHTVRFLESDNVVAPGALRAVDELEVDRTPNGTTFAESDLLSEGDTYTAVSYAPDPSAAQMRRASDAYAPALAHHTTIRVPSNERPVGGAPAPAQPIVVPLRTGGPAGEGDVASRLESSQYGDVYELARRLTAGASTTYDAVKSIEVHLQRNYAYRETVRPDELPLHAFLFEDRAGFCEHFSGSMALMLRTLGIPARIATGFSPGTRDPNREGHFEVRDFDAHSWVEVYFTGIGWVPFDPTPAAAPAELQAGGFVSDSAASGLDAAETPRGGLGTADPTPAQGSGWSPSIPPIPLWPFAAALGLFVLAGVALTAARVVRERSLAPAGAAEARTRELESALARLRWPLPEGITLLSLEKHLRTLRPGAAADYVAGLRAHRFAGDGAPLPSRSERRRMRRELAPQGSRMPLGAYLAIPPGAPRMRPGGTGDGRS